jgi:hypothetical protein
LQQDLLFLGGGVVLNVVVAFMIVVWPCPDEAHSASLCAWPLQAVLATINAIFMSIDFFLTLTANRSCRGSAAGAVPLMLHAPGACQGARRQAATVRPTCPGMPGALSRAPR